MTALHLLRPFCLWYGPKREPLRTVDQAADYVAHVASCGFKRFSTWTRRSPARIAELKGGSVYFVKNRVTLFRMPFICVEDETDAMGNGRPLVAIVMQPQLIRVAPHRVGMVRGWRYLRDVDAPADATAGDGGELPPDMRRDLRELGLD